ncbi:MAG: trimethylamine methyltransferase family protein [Thermodesulfobacteriota bacterium]|nr:trimethylamine methyltransferase family protein [Thermodesulfobacteriota bacterium]
MLNTTISYFSQDKLGVMGERVFELLEKNGVKMDHPEVAKLLSKAGANVDFDSQIVRFPKKFLEEQIIKAPKNFVLEGRSGKFKLEIPREDGTFHTRTNTGGQTWIEPETGKYRRVTISDVATWAKLSYRLENIGFSAFPVPNDVPTATADIYALSAMLQNTEKHVWVQPYTEGSVKYLIELSIAAAGGEDALKNNPLVSFITCSLTPLEFKYMDLDIILQSSRKGIPLHACSLPGAGTTGPITESGVVLLSVAEILVMLATAQVIQPGIPIVATPLIFSADMSTGRSLQSSVDSMRSNALAVQFIKNGFGIPVHTYGIGADSPIMDGQCMSEGALRSMLISSSGADILGGAGQIETATTISPLQLAIDNEVFGMVRHIITEMPFDDDSMAWDDLMEVMPGGEFLTKQHTLQHCRDGLPPINFIRSDRETWEKKGQGDLVERAKEFCRQLLKKPTTPIMNDDVVKEMDSIVKSADEHLT